MFTASGSGGSRASGPVTFHDLWRCWAVGEGSPLPEVLPEQRLRELCEKYQVATEHSVEEVWSPMLTIWTFVTQVMSASKCCVAAVARSLVLRLALGLPPCGAGTGAYCKARQRLPEGLLRDLAFEVGETLERQTLSNWRWKDRHAFLLDGTTLTAADTPANQAAYPQPSSQQPGLGFPLIRLVVLMGFASAAVTAAELGPCQGKRSGEPSLARKLLAQLRSGDVLVGDRNFCSYWLAALAISMQIDIVFRLHHQRRRDGAGRHDGGRRVLGPGEAEVIWRRPPRPSWMDPETYAGLPVQLVLREVEHRVEEAGFRTKTVVIVTTLKDRTRYTASDLTDLYRQRWRIELDLRSLKQSLRMEHLVCKSPDMVRKEVWVHLVGYNLIRQGLAQAAAARSTSPRQLSFAGGFQALQEFRQLLLHALPGQCRLILETLWRTMAEHTVGDRPQRVEPRRIKRRPKKYPHLHLPRAQARQELLQPAA